MTRAVGPLALAFISCLLPIELHAADIPSGIQTAVDGAFRPLLEEHDVPGIAVGVTVDGQRYFFNYGVAAKDSKAPVTQDTLFEIGSVSKTFTATLASYAEVLGKISLSDHPGKYLPELRQHAIDQATLLHLGTYTAGGLPLQVPDAVNNDSEMATYLQHWKPAAAPGAQRRYSNPSIGLFGHIAGLAMDGDFADLVEARLFPPLGLQHSYIRVPEAEMDRYAWGYNKTNKPTRVGPGVFDAEAYGV
ncbi:MAG TPA: serine hydrolase, partial [Dongiaceae bacterium]|nr:serine hydrolase [Dongiaceae bacterium]